jgi:hypothetical protein
MEHGDKEERHSAMNSSCELAYFKEKAHLTFFFEARWLCPVPARRFARSSFSFILTAGLPRGKVLDICIIWKDDVATAVDQLTPWLVCLIKALVQHPDVHLCAPKAARM